MYNGFVLIGPKSDPPASRQQGHVTALEGHPGEGRALPCRAATARAPTRRARVVEEAASTSRPEGPWYRTSTRAWGGAQHASAMNAYVLADRGTWISFKNRDDSRCGRRRRQAVQPIRVILVQSRQTSARSRRRSPGFHRLADIARGQKRSPTTRSTATAVLPQRRQAGSMTRGLAALRALLVLVAIVPSWMPQWPTPPIRSCCMPAGSLRGALNEMAAAYEKSSGIRVTGEIRRLRPAARRDCARREGEVFASANMEHPRRSPKPARADPWCCSRATSLALVRRATVAPRACSTGCSRPIVKLGHLDAKADPSGDYAGMFRKAMPSGRAPTRSHQEGLAAHGRPAGETPSPTQPLRTLVRKTADIFLTYCNQCLVPVRENPGERMWPPRSRWRSGPTMDSVMVTASRPPTASPCSSVSRAQRIWQTTLTGRVCLH